MGTRKCCVKECTSEEGNEGITFHRFPQTNHENAEKWLKACKFESSFKPNKHSFVCSQHFRRENFTILQSGKIILKSLTVPSIFPWNKDTIVVTKATISIASDGESPDKKKKPEKSKDDTTITEKIKDETGSPKKEVTTPTKIEEPLKAQSSKKRGCNAKKKEIPKPLLSPEKPKKSSKRLSAKLQQNEIQAKKAKVEETEEESVDTPVTVKSDPIVSTPKKKNLIVNFIPGNTIEAQNFDGKWIPVKIIEVDTDEREVLVRSADKNNKAKAGINDEWISMDSPRLRPAQPTVTFEVGEKVLARWNDCRKFPATIKRVCENDSYDVLFDDGYPKIVRGIHIHKYSAKNAPKGHTTEPSPVLINPLFLNPPSLIPDYIKEMKDLPKGPSEGEWCCLWVDDIPVGEESTFDGTHGKVPSIIIPDWRIKDGWQKHIYLRQNGKWDVLFISPTNRRLRFKNELKAYLAEIGEIYDPEIWDFSLHKKRSKALDLCIQSGKFKHQSMPHSFQIKNQQSADGTLFSNPFANLGALPYVQPNLVTAAPIQTEVCVGSLKVKVINNNYHCPGSSCDKIFRKENHLQIHIKHYHENLAKLMGECPNMEDLAYLRTTVDEAEITMVKSNRKSNLMKEKSKTRHEFNDSFKEPHVKLENISAELKLIAQRSPILEEALKAPLITSQMTPVKNESDLDSNLESTPNSFDPESLIPPYSVTRPNLKAHTRRKMRIRFNPKPKKHGQKKHKFDYQNGEGVSAVEGVIPYNEGPYFKNQQQSSYIDENGEVIKIVRMKKEEIINCVCGYGEEDGLMIQCELCLCWQHGICHGYEKSTQVPDKHVCLICKNPYRQRTSKRFFHDQDWLYDGKLSIANYHLPNPKQTARFDTLKSCHTLIGNLIEMKKFMNSLDVKMNIAENIEHPKMYLWAKKWEQSPPRESIDNKDDIKLGADIKIQSVAPEPEAAIEPRKCQQNLLDHIQNQQNTVKMRLDNIEKEIGVLEDEGSSKILNGKKPIDDSTLKQTLYMLINDMKQMNDFSDIHRNPIEES
ncbi:hypothetical protein ACKWTF_003161 [Chironomus riparius]